MARDMQQAPIPMIMTRPEAGGQAFVRNMPADLRQRLKIIESPLLSIEAVVQDPGSDDAGAAIFTSANGVRFAPEARGRKAWCVGRSTTQAARDAGWDAVTAGPDSAGLIETLRRERPEVSLVHFSGVHTRGKVVEKLAEDGLSVRRVTVYDQPLLALSEAARAVLAGDDPVIVPLFSPRTAAWFVEQCPEPGNVIAVFLSAAVARATGQARFAQQVISAWPDARSVVNCIENLTVSARPG